MATAPELLELLAQLRAAGIRLWADAGTLRYSAPPGSLTPALRTALTARKSELLAFLGAAAQDLHSPDAPILPVARAVALPLSFTQQRFWLLEQLAGDSAAYCVPVAVRLRGELDRSALQRSLTTLVRRHESLRTIFRVEDEQLVQVILTPPSTNPGDRVPLPLTNLARLPEAERAAALGQHLTAAIAHPFDLAHGPLLRPALFQLGADEHVLLLTLHHIIVDGWSLEVLSRELSALYSAFVSGQAATLPPLPIQYADFAHWQRQWFQASNVEGDSPLSRQLAYWRRQLEGAPPLDLPTDHPRPLAQTYCGASYRFPLEGPLVDALRDLGQRAGATPFMGLLAVFQLLLQRYSGQDDFCVGVPSAGRSRPECDGLIGCFVNTLALRADCSGNPSFRTLLDRVRTTALEAYAHQEAPFEQVVAAVQPERTASYQALFQVMFALEAPAPPLLQVPGLASDGLPLHSASAKFDLTLTIETGTQGWTGTFEYNTDLFAPDPIARMAGHFLTLLAACVADPDALTATLPLLTVAERQQQLVDWNATSTPGDGLSQGLHQLFEQQVERTPAALAVVAASLPGATGPSAPQPLTYRELNARANQLARYLRQRGVGPGVLVGLCLERSPNLIVALLAILKAGGAYLPLDRAYPPERWALMLRDARPGLVLVDGQLAAAAWLTTLLSDLQLEQCAITDAWPALEREQPTNLDLYMQPDALAYVIYTSGSTGIPKGVLIPHRAVVNHNLAVQHHFSLRPGDRVLQFATLTFDAAVEEIFPTLASGATLVLRPDGPPPSGLELLRLADELQLTLLDLPTAYWHLLVEELAQARRALPPSLRLVVVGGEQVDAERLRDWLRLAGATVRWMNSYGPTEATVIATLYELAPAATPATLSAPVPIGRPLANVQLFILDRAGQPVPLGVPGELYIGGAGLALGYLNQPALTAERFVTLAHLGSETPLRLYRTGDRVRYRPDGVVEFLGRLDQQLKIRGYRVEPGEVAAVLRQHPDVHEALVVGRADQPEGLQLVAYVVPAGDQAPLIGPLRAWLAERLPDYMLPAAVVGLAALPQTPGGKLDLRALPPPPYAEPTPLAATDRPRSPEEHELAALWASALGMTTIGIHDSFFELGGHSLLAARLAMQIRDYFQIDLSLRSFFVTPTVAGLAQQIVALRAQAGPATAIAEPDLAAEALLDLQLQPAALAAPGAEPAAVLLTGASGFLGAFLLAELLRQTRATLHCLVRAPNRAAGATRIRQNLSAYGLWDENFAPRIIPVPGDLERPRLGLTGAAFAELAATIEAIYHNGAQVNMLAPYALLRPANVEGTRTIIQLAALGRPTPVHYISTLSVFDQREFLDGRSIDEDDGLGSGEGLLYGYAQSKWVADKLMLQARTQGLPVAIYRLGSVTGASQSGAWNTGDYLCRLIKGCIQLGLMPDLDKVFGLVPVDFVSQAIVTLARRPQTPGQVFHLDAPQGLHLRQLAAWINAYGYPLDLAPYARWQAALVEQTRAGAEHALYPLLALFVEHTAPDLRLTLPELFVRGRAPTFTMRNTASGLRDSGVVCPPPDARLLSTYFTYFVHSGFLEPPPGVARAEQGKEILWDQE